MLGPYLQLNLSYHLPVFRFGTRVVSLAGDVTSMSFSFSLLSSISPFFNELVGFCTAVSFFSNTWPLCFPESLSSTPEQFSSSLLSSSIRRAFCCLDFLTGGESCSTDGKFVFTGVSTFAFKLLVLKLEEKNSKPEKHINIALHQKELNDWPLGKQ